jgi:type I restriction enzyme S subunit
MNAERLLQHFDRLSEAPDAIPRLRRFILDLAVRGKLVDQDPNDEPAAELLKRIQAEKETLVKGGKIRRQDLLPPVDQHSISFQVPGHWAWLQLSGLGLLSGGMTPSKNRPDFWDGDINWFSPKDIKSDELIESELKITSAGVAETGLQLYRPGCLFMVARSGILKRTFPVAINRVEATANQDLKVLTPFIEGLERYLQIMFRGITEYILSALVKTGTTVQSLKYEEFELQPLPLPPLAEQHRIVAKVDELMAVCDQLEAARIEREQSRDRLVAATLHRLNHPADAEEANTPEAFRDHARFTFINLSRLTTRPAYIKQLRQTILSLAVRGKLVPQDPNDEPAAELLKRVEAEKMRLVKQGTIKRQLPVVPLKVDELLPGVPDNWEWARFSDLLLGDSQNGYSKKPDDALDGIPILRISAGTVRKDGIVAEEEHKLIGGVSVSQQKQFQLQPGDLLACRFNGNRTFVGRLSLYTGYLGIKPIYPDKLIRLRLLSQFVLPKLVMYFAESNDVRTDIESYCATTVGNWGISASNLKEVKIPLPPLAEQHRIVAKLDELMALCDQLEAQLTATEADDRRLLEAVLHEALNPTLKVTEHLG